MMVEVRSMASSYGWVITKDTLGEPSGVGVNGPRDISDDMVARLKAGEGDTFRMKDDDGEVYYVGRFVGDSTSEDGFGPLDDYGRPNAGAVMIEYKRGRTWEVL
jgi:hypothetical protein